MCSEEDASNVYDHSVRHQNWLICAQALARMVHGPDRGEGYSSAAIQGRGALPPACGIVGHLVPEFEASLTDELHLVLLMKDISRSIQ
jgi:hypothetical protein